MWWELRDPEGDQKEIRGRSEGDQREIGGKSEGDQREIGKRTAHVHRLNLKAREPHGEWRCTQGGSEEERDVSYAIPPVALLP